MIFRYDAPVVLKMMICAPSLFCIVVFDLLACFESRYVTSKTKDKSYGDACGFSAAGLLDVCVCLCGGVMMRVVLFFNAILMYVLYV